MDEAAEREAWSEAIDLMIYGTCAIAIDPATGQTRRVHPMRLRAEDQKEGDNG